MSDEWEWGDRLPFAPCENAEDTCTREQPCPECLPYVRPVGVDETWDGGGWS